MKPEAKRLLKAAKQDLEFQEELKVHEPRRYKLNLLPNPIDEMIYVSVYMGWLIGKGRYKESDYDL